MTCENTYEQLAAFSQSDLPPERQRSLSEHLASCEACRRKLAKLQTVDASLRALSPERPSAETILAARRLVSEEIRPRREPEILTLEEVAQFLRITPDDLRPYVEDLPAFELGGQIRVRRSRLLEWVERRERSFSPGSPAGVIARLRPVEPWKGVAL